MLRFMYAAKIITIVLFLYRVSAPRTIIWNENHDVLY